jgi:molecular chaperone Hsp33
MEDYLVRIITENKNIRAMACVTTNLVNEGRARHGTYPTATAALGRALTGGELMGALLDGDQRVALKFEGDGPLKKIIVEAQSNGTVRGYVEQPEVELPPKNGKLDVAGALGTQGYLTVTKDLQLKKPYMGVVQLYTGEIASDLAYYLTESEQIPSAVGLGVFVEPDGHVSAAGGFLLQSLPPSDEELIDTLAGRIENMQPVTRQLREGKLPEDLLADIFRDVSFTILEKKPLSFVCTCSRQRIEQALIALGHEEIRRIIKDDDIVDITCQFCRKQYVFDREELEQILHEIH